MTLVEKDRIVTTIQILSASYDDDTGILRLTASNNAHYVVTAPAHAVILKNTISPGGMLNETQIKWLERYRVLTAKTDKSALLTRLSVLRRELHATHSVMNSKINAKNAPF